MLLKVSGYDEERMLDMMAEKLVERAANELDKRVADAVEAAVASTAEKLARERLEAECERVLTEGWQKTDQYGAPQGKVMSLKDRMSEMLNRTTGYNSQRWADELIQKAMTDHFGRAFRDESNALLNKFRAQADELLSSKIAEMLKSALGLAR